MLNGLSEYRTHGKQHLGPRHQRRGDGHHGGRRPGACDLLAARTQYFDKFLNDAVGKCIRQVVILASGLDARGYRLSWPAGTVVFEIDQPAVLAFKAATLGELKAAPTADVRAVPIDLRHDWPAALHDAGFGTGKPTAWIAEGLLPFLPSDAQDRLLDNITALSAGGSRLASEVAQKGLDSDQTRESDERNDVDAYLAQRGWQSAKTPAHQLLADAGMPPIPQVDGAEQ